MKKSIISVLSLALLVIITSCTTYQGGAPSPQQEREMTVGIVQREIKMGMSAADVAEILGSPNIVTKDNADSETWVYDKIATEVTYSESSSGYFLILAGGSSRSATASVQQKTLTVVIKFDENSKVSDLKYHSSKF